MPVTHLLHMLEQSIKVSRTTIDLPFGRQVLALADFADSPSETPLTLVLGHPIQDNILSITS